jgi:uncharacterized membrane protein YfcA
MIELIILSLAALIASLLTFFSGFGLGTILMPVFAIFFPVEIAIALTGVVHFLNNIFKLVLMRLQVEKMVVIRFGLPAFFSALLGAYLLVKLGNLEPLYSYAINSEEFAVTPAKLVVAILLMFFALVEILPVLKNVQFRKDLFFVGGLLSGFFGGLSGMQGALRSAFLTKAGLTKESFIATGVAIACIIDLSRLGVYFTRFSESGLYENMRLVAAATLSALVGAYVGSRLLPKVTMRSIQVIVTTLLIILSIALGLGLV